MIERFSQSVMLPIIARLSNSALWHKVEPFFQSAIWHRIERSARLIWRQINVQLRIRTFDLYSLALLIIQPAIFSGVGMLLSRAAGNEKPDLIYIVIGGGMLGMWSGMVFTSTFDIGRDRRDGMLELIVASPTSLGAVEAIRTLTNVLAGLVSMLVAFVAALLIFDYPIAQMDGSSVCISLLMIVLGMWSIGVFLANFTVLSRVSGSYVEFVEIPIPLICGFMYPLGILPQWMQTLSAVIPVRWGLEALDAAILHNHHALFYWERWGMSLILSLMFWGLARWMEVRVQDRIRVTGEMSSI